VNPLSYLKSMLTPVKVAQVEVLAEGDHPPQFDPGMAADIAVMAAEPTTGSGMMPVDRVERTDPLAGLSEAQRAELLGRLETLMRDKRVLTPAAQRRIRAGDVSSSLVASAPGRAAQARVGPLSRKGPTTRAAVAPRADDRVARPDRSRLSHSRR